MLGGIDVTSELFVRGLILGFTIAAAVGPIALLVMRRTVAEGRLVGVVSGLGVATADGIYGGVAAFGLTAITDLLVGGGRLLGLIGGIFLLWLAWRTATSVPTTEATVTERRGGVPGAYLSTLGLTLTNPMTIIAFGALFAGLGVRGDDLAESVTLTAGVFLGSAAWWIVLTTVVGAVRHRITPRWIRVINIVSGVAIAGFALLSISIAIRG